MRSRLIVVAVLALLLMALSQSALAKGPARASIEGDGIKGVLDIDQRGELGQGTPMSDLVERLGFFHLVFDEWAKVRAEQPTKDLGAERMVIHWDMGDGSSIVQELYLHAAGGPVTHVAPGQVLWEDMAAVGGWMRVSGDIATPLVALGVDESAVAHLLKQSSDKAASITKVEAAKTGEAGVEKPSVEPAIGDDKSEASADVVPAAERAPSSPVARTGVVPMVATLAALALGLIGAAAWIRMRRPAIR